MEEKEQQQVYLSPEIRQQTKIKCVQENLSFSAAVSQLLEMWLSNEVRLTGIDTPEVKA